MGNEIFYHGSGSLFSDFDLDHALEGDGKVKFGYGVYVTSSYSSAAHYSGVNDSWDNHYIYTVKIPDKTEDNFIAFKQSVNPMIISRAEDKLRISIPTKVKEDGKDFRKFIAKRFMPKNVSDKKFASLEGERLASLFLMSIGVEFIEWPYSWKNPSLGKNRVVLDDKKVNIVRIESVDLNDKKELISSSIRRVK